MADHSGWYPPGQVCYPPQLPPYLKNVYDLKPIVGVPSDTDVIGIHSVILAANRVSGVPGMHDPGLLMGLADHLFGAQMAKYRSKYSLITFPSNATYTPPELPTHISVKLEPVSGVPSDEEMMRAQEALRSYQQFSHAPSMFDSSVNMELSQHLFDLQMARYMRLAGESPSNPLPQATARAEIPVRTVERSLNTAGQLSNTTNNAGTGASAATIHQAPQTPTSSVGTCEFLEQSNHLYARLIAVLEHSNELIERNQTTHWPDSQASEERFNQVLERLTRMEQSHRQTEQSDRLTERFNQLFERFNQLVEQATLPAQRANELAERSNALADRANQLAENLYQSSERSNTLSEQGNKSWRQLEGILGNINKVLMRIQHAIVRNHKGNTISALDCLVNEKGETINEIEGLIPDNFQLEAWMSSGRPDYRLPVVIDGTDHDAYLPDSSLGGFLRFYGIDSGLFEDATGVSLNQQRVADARQVLTRYLSSCLG